MCDNKMSLKPHGINVMILKTHKKRMNYSYVIYQFTIDIISSSSKGLIKKIHRLHMAPGAWFAHACPDCYQSVPQHKKQYDIVRTFKEAKLTAQEK